MAMIPDDFGIYRRFDEDPSTIPDLPFRPYPITIEDLEKIKSTLFPPPLGAQLCCASNEAMNTTDKDKIKKIKDLVKKCVNLNVYIDGENIFKKILEICEGK